ncbi:DUF4012 domain-containing protein [Patescibacteria group bacterium]|nr:DUF4012 domain-containing protein [Patescibacteria group bacterium]
MPDQMKQKNPSTKTNLVEALDQDPLKSSSKKQRKAKRKWPKIVAAVLVVMLLVFGILSVVSINPAKAAYASAMEGKSKLMEAQQAVEAQEFERAASLITESKKDFEKTDESIKKLKWVKVIPFARHQFIAAEHLMKGSLETVSALETVLNVADRIMSSVGDDGGGGIQDMDSEKKGEILKALRESSPELERAVSQFELAEMEFEQIPEKGVVEQIAEARSLIQEKLPQIKKIIKEVSAAAKLLPALAGYPEEQSYFILFENNTELRPAGGFIGTYGVSTIKNAEIVEFTTHDVYSLDKDANINVEPPWQIKKLVNPYLTSWNLRDANWSPDFPTAAQKAMWFYDIEGGQKEFDGVVAITPDFIGYLLEITGPSQVPGFPYTFTHENIASQLEFHVERNYVSRGIDFHERKDIISDLAQVLIAKILTLPKEEWPKVFEVVQRAFLEKHLVLYIENEETENFLKEKNWAGDVKDVSGDFAMVVDANMASLKTDEFIERGFVYEADFSGDTHTAKMAMSYKNTSPGITWKTTRYRNWNRLYTPQGSELLSIEGNEQGSQFYNEPGQTYEVMDELMKTAFGTFISIEPSEEKTLTYNYTLPDSAVSKDEYTLYFQKQIGTIKPKLKVKLKFDRPVKSFAPAEYGEKVSDNEIEFNLDLQTDREFKVTF